MRPVIVVTAVVIVASLALDLLSGAVPIGYSVAIGLGGCVGIILISKWVGRFWLQRPQDYWSEQVKRRD